MTYAMRTLIREMGTSVRKVAGDVLFGSGEGKLVDPVVDVGKILLGKGRGVHWRLFKSKNFNFFYQQLLKRIYFNLSNKITSSLK